MTGNVAVSGLAGGGHGRDALGRLVAAGTLVHRAVPGASDAVLIVDNPPATANWTVTETSQVAASLPPSVRRLQLCSASFIPAEVLAEPIGRYWRVPWRPPYAARQCSFAAAVAARGRGG